MYGKQIKTCLEVQQLSIVCIFSLENHFTSKNISFKSPKICHGTTLHKTWKYFSIHIFWDLKIKRWTNLDEGSLGEFLVDLGSVGDVLSAVSVVQGTQSLLYVTDGGRNGRNDRRLGASTERVLKKAGQLALSEEKLRKKYLEVDTLPRWIFVLFAVLFRRESIIC